MPASMVKLPAMYEPQMSSIQLAITGGTGFVGSALVRQIESSSRPEIFARALVRGSEARISSQKIRNVPGDLEVIPPDLFPFENFVLVHFATKQIDIDGTGFEQVNVHGTARLLAALPSQCAGVIYGSSMSVYGQGSQRDIDELQPVAPVTPLAKSRRRAEELITQDAQAKGRPAILLRPRFILGRGDKHTLPGLRRLFLSGKTIGDESQRFSIIDVDDYARIVLLLAQRMVQGTLVATHEAYPLNIGYLRPVSLLEIRQALRCPAPSLRIPFGPRLADLAARVPLLSTSELLTKLQLMGLDHVAQVSRLVEWIGSELPSRDPLAVLDDAVADMDS